MDFLKSFVCSILFFKKSAYREEIMRFGSTQNVKAQKITCSCMNFANKVVGHIDSVLHIFSWQLCLT